ncbi:MAG: hypothetical protein KKA90_03720 [Nanoarchaeota archaeon]|nr:hypothetical protein [Nanoarchaeota archaeon]
MSRNKASGRKRRLINRATKRDAPRWADIKKFGLKRARTRRIRASRRNWRRDHLKV